MIVELGSEITRLMVCELMFRDSPGGQKIFPDRLETFSKRFTNSHETFHMFRKRI